MPNHLEENEKFPDIMNSHDAGTISDANQVNDGKVKKNSERDFILLEQGECLDDWRSMIIQTAKTFSLKL